jgi:hypothetical protein
MAQSKTSKARSERAAGKARPDLEAYELSIRLPLADVVGRLNDILSPKLVAYIAGMGETRAVKQWAAGDRLPKADVEPKLRTALRIALFLAEHDGPSVVQAWFQGLNPQLSDISPARLLRTEAPDEAGPAALSAARAFVVGG